MGSTRPIVTSNTARARATTRARSPASRGKCSPATPPVPVSAVLEDLTPGHDLPLPAGLEQRQRRHDARPRPDLQAVGPAVHLERDGQQSEHRQRDPGNGNRPQRVWRRPITSRSEPTRATASTCRNPDGALASVSDTEKESQIVGNTEATRLKPDTTYHFRVVATNEQGTTEGLDHTFHTFPSAEETHRRHVPMPMSASRPVPACSSTAAATRSSPPATPAATTCSRT